MRCRIHATRRSSTYARGTRTSGLSRSIRTPSRCARVRELVATASRLHAVRKSNQIKSNQMHLLAQMVPRSLIDPNDHYVMGRDGIAHIGRGGELLDFVGTNDWVSCPRRGCPCQSDVARHTGPAIPRVPAHFAHQIRHVRACVCGHVAHVSASHTRRLCGGCSGGAGSIVCGKCSRASSGSSAARSFVWRR